MGVSALLLSTSTEGLIHIQVVG